jgi:preprotein translocase subunit YajC
MHWLLLLADGEQGAPPGLFGTPMIPMMMIFGIMMIMMMRSSSRQRREQQALLANVKKNDKVVTSAGIIGVIVALKENEDEVTLRVDDTTNSRIRVLKSSIVRVTTEEQQLSAQSSETKTS